jgi:xanthine/uracil/vitamin C permease (AzgA family)
MKKFLWTSIGINFLGIILLTSFVILPRWYFGLGRTPQLIMEFSLPIIVVGQIVAAIIWSRKYKGSIIIGILPIMIPIWYYFEVVRPLIIAYM